MKALIACQAGQGIGLGHLTRMQVAARALLAAGIDVQLVLQTNGDTVAASQLTACAYLQIDAADNLCESIRLACHQDNVDLLLLDLAPQRVPAQLETLIADLREQAVRVVAIDGLFTLWQRLDLIFVPSFRNAKSLGLPAQAPLLSGWDCYLLNPQQQPACWQAGSRVLVLTGGSDATGLGQHWPAELDQCLPAGTEVHWVVGPYAAAPSQPLSPRLSWYWHQAPQGLDELMCQCQYAMTPLGVSFFELLFYGVPTVVFSPYGDKDQQELAEIAESGVALTAEDASAASDRLVELMQNQPLAQQLSRQAQTTLKPEGGAKLATAVQQLLRK